MLHVLRPRTNIGEVAGAALSRSSSIWSVGRFPLLVGSAPCVGCWQQVLEHMSFWTSLVLFPFAGYPCWSRLDDLWMNCMLF